MKLIKDINGNIIIDGVHRTVVHLIKADNAEPISSSIVEGFTDEEIKNMKMCNFTFIFHETEEGRDLALKTSSTEFRLIQMHNDN